MWFIIRTVFCIGIVFSLTPGGETIDEANVPAVLATAGPATRQVVDGALLACTNDPKHCLDAARRLAPLRTAAFVPSAKDPGPDLHLVADTLTAADRTPRWRGGAKEPRGSTHARAAARPST